MAKDKTEILDNWKALNEGLKQLAEDEAYRLLQVERSDKKRLQFLLRLYGRFNTLRTIRERAELAAEII